MRLKHLLSVFLTLLTLSVGQMWGAEGTTHDFSQSLSQLLNNNASISSINIAAQDYTVKEVIVTWSHNKNISNAVTIAVSVGETSFGSANVYNKSNQTTSFKTSPQTSASGAISISFTNNTGSGTGHGTFSVSNVRLVEGAPATKYDVHWSINGVIVEDEELSGKPSVPEDVAELAADETCNGKVFVGWTASAINGSTNTAPTDLFTEQAGTAISGETTYHAVYATATPANKSVTYPISSKSTFGTPTGTAPAGSSASIVETYSTSKQMTSGNSQTVTLTGWGTTNITGITLSMRSNSSGGKGTLKYSTNGGTSYTNIISDKNFNTSDWYGSWSTSYVNVSKSVNITGVANQTIKIAISASANSLYCQSYTFNYTGVTYSNYATSCCTPLGSINGSVSVTNLSRTGATVSWAGPTSNASGYEYSFNGSDWINTGVAANAASPSFNLTGLTGATSYTIYLRAKGNGTTYSDGPATSGITFKTLSRVSAVENNDTYGTAKVSLTNGSGWADYVDAADGTTIYLQATAANATYTFSGWSDPSSGSISNGQLTGWSGDVNLTANFALAELPKLPTPMGMASTVALNSATVSWNAVANATGYAVTCVKTSDQSTTGIVIGSIDGTSCTISGLTAGTGYTWTVQALGNNTTNKNSDACTGQTFTTLSITGISVQTAPTAAYLVGDNFNPTGLIITRTYSNSTTDTYTYAGHTGEFTFSPATNAALAANNDEVTITWNGLSTKQSINVYTVTVNKIDMGETPAAITAEGVTAGCSGRTLSQSVGSTNYKFNSFVVSAGGVGISGTSITGTPTGNVIINAKFHKPISITWKVGDGNAGSGTTEVKYGTAMNTLSLPTAPLGNALASCGTNTFMGWSEHQLIGAGHDDPGDLFKSITATTPINEDKTFYAVFANETGGGVAANTILFFENWTGHADDSEPSAPNTGAGYGAVVYGGASITYKWVDGTTSSAGTSEVQNENLTLADAAPEAKIGKKGSGSGAVGGYLSIAGIPSGGAKTLTISYQQNANSLTASVIGDGYSGTRSNSSKAAQSFDVTVGTASTFTLKFQAAGNNVRLDDIEVKVKETNVSYSDYQTSCCPAHNVNITTPTNGTVEANKTKACENDAITLTITPNTGYQLSALMVGGNNVTASVSEGSYSFDMPDADVAVSATFAAKHHNVVFHKNDGSDATDTQDYAYGETKALKANGWSRDNYNFGGWMTSTSGESADYSDGYSYTLSVDANVDLYALWIPDNTRSITYNGDAHISSYTAQPATVAEDAANIAITFALESNYELKSVAVTMGGAAIAADKIAFTQSSLTITAPAGGFTDNISITYTIEEMKYTVHFSINGNVTDKQVVRGQTLNDIPTPGALTGFTFEGWASATLAETTTEPASYALSKTATSYTPSEDNVTFYAVYSRVEETELDGFKLSYTTSTPSTYYASPMGTNSYFGYTSDAANAEILFEEAAETPGQVYLYFYNGNNKTYIYTGTTDNANITKNTLKSYAKAWTKGDEGDGKVSYTSTQNSRYIAYNAGQPRFAVYNNNNYDKALTPTAAKKTIEATLYSTTAVVPVLDHITITTAPTKTAYFEGDDFEAAGMVVTGTYNTGDKVLKASQYTISPSTNLEAGTTSVTIAAVEDNTKTASQSITVTAIALTSITITTPPTKTVYVVGQNFNPTGMVVTAHYNDNSKDKAVTGYTMTPSTSTALTAEDDHIEISYTEGGVTKTANQAITVNAALTGIEITTNPDKMTYIETETFEATGMVVTAHYNGSSDKNVTSSVTWDKTGVLAALNSLNASTVETITFTYEESGAEVTTTLDVTVNPYPRYTVTFSANGTLTNVTETAGQGGVTVPADPAGVGDYTFAGWSKSQRAVESADDPALVTITAGKYYPTSTETLYAVYTMDKEDEVAGMLLSYDDSGTEKYIGAYNSSSTRFAVETDIANALPLWYKDGYLFYMNGKTPTYVFNTQSTKADIDYSTTKHNSADWVRSEADGKVMFQSTTNTTRYLGYNSQSSSMFRAYTSNYQLTATTSATTATFEIPFYTTAPSADVTPTISFAETSKTITVVDENGALNTCTNALTTNSTGSVSYASSDETVATVAANGTVSVKKVGEVTITANVAAVAGTWKAISKSYTLTIEKAIASASFGEYQTIPIVYKDNTIALPATSAQAITITYSCSNPEYATVDASGNVTGIATTFGTNNQRQVTIYAEWAATDYYYASTNSTRGSQKVNIKNNAKTQTLSFTDEAKDFGSDQGDKVYTNTLNGAKTSVTYASSDETVAEVDENTGEVTVHTNAAGSATITATAAADDNVIEDGIRYAYAQAQASYEISIVYPRPTISVASCEFKAPFEVELSSEATNLEMIVYTTDGTDPSFAGNKGDIYTEPIAINATTTLKAIAVSDENEESPVATATYTKLVPEFTEWSFEDGESVAMNVEQTITASEGAVITYIISKGGVEVANATTESNVATFTLTEAGNYEVDAEAQWNVANGFVSESVSRTIHVKGAVHLPISYTGNGTGVASEPYFATTGTALGNYGEANVNAPIKMSGTCSLTAEFLDEPSSVIFYVGKNSSGDLTSTLTVEESANGVDYEVVQTYDDNNLSTAVTSQMTSGYNGGGVKEKLTLKPTTRFVRWSFVKNNGNVGIGKIKIYQKEIVMDESSDVLPEDFSGDVIVPTGTSLYIIEDTELGNLTVEKGAEVDNLADLTVKDFFIEAQEGASGQILDPAELNVTGQAYYDLTLNTTGTMDNSKWYAFAVPFQVDAATGIQRLSNDGKTSNAGFNSHYRIKKYDSARRLSTGKGWVDVTSGETLYPGHFYMISLNSNVYNRLRMTKKAGTNLSNIGAIDLVTNGASNNYDANWNALANNALAYVNVSASGANSELKVQVYNSATNNYTPYAYNKVTFTVGTPFFLQAAEVGTMSVNIAASNNETVKAPAREAVATEEFEIRLGANTESYYDILYVSASDEALNEYQIGHDLQKAGVSTTVPQMYIPAYGAKLCDAEFPLVNNEATFPLTFTIPTAGMYQLYLADAPEDANLYLQKNGVTVWDMTAGAYALEIESGTNTEYSLLLKIKENTMTGVDQINAKAGVQKVVINEHVYILRGGEMYDMTGKMVK